MSGAACFLCGFSLLLSQSGRYESDLFVSDFRWKRFFNRLQPLYAQTGASLFDTGPLGIINPIILELQFAFLHEVRYEIDYRSDLPASSLRDLLE
jgi:hypothetical protein